MGKALDVLGHRYDRLTVIAYEGPSEDGKRRLWRAMCDCGNEVVTSAGAMRGGNPLSCGCGQRDAASRVCKERSTTHGMSKKRLYSIWHTMRQRCGYKKNIVYPIYGGRGIKVCEEWQSFEVFRDWALANGYGAKLQIDRIDNDGNYCPGNCRWVTAKQNTRNKSNNRLLTVGGETLTVAEWSERTGIGGTTILYRIAAGHSAEACLTEGRIKHKDRRAAKTVPVR